MRIFYGLDNVHEIQRAVVTTGSFDGVHIGHQAIINRLKKIAADINGESTLITFNPHPRKVLYPDTVGKDLLLINSQREKIEMLEKTGLDNLLIIEFTLAFSKTSSLDFIREMLLEKLHAKCIIVGFNHHFGHNREGDFEELRRLSAKDNFMVEEIPEQDIRNESVSSTKIRRALLEGNIQKANAYLDTQYTIMGPVTNSHDILEKIGFPSYLMTIEEECKLIPPNGLYAISFHSGDFTSRGMCFIRKNPHDTLQTVVDFYLFEDLAGRTIQDGKLLFHKRIRDEKPLHDPIELQNQLRIDKSVIEELIY
ncbi:MAG: riboflavin biosynthesis protein RibF [Bacteroidetes bacterium]|nr:riboflavin biosynthesis protein RibF [Bacteroidota bacterium]